MKLMEHELKLKFPLNKINSFVLVNEFVAVLKVYIYGPSLLQIIHLNR